ncbi:unnamed protein product [Chrysodeixis includens]|uniref:Uncharacterized protein n=1 Tax=Chrysodeixis includens TaxID=689277 RepID=A0A9N8L0G0_CHRIL|nr:unnamed protein product [Chrysodeixis includens]
MSPARSPPRNHDVYDCVHLGATCHLHASLDPAAALTLPPHSSLPSFIFIAIHCCTRPRSSRQLFHSALIAARRLRCRRCCELSLPPGEGRVTSEPRLVLLDN